MNEDESREAYFELKVIEEQMGQIQNQISILESNISEFENSIKYLEDLRGKSDEDAFVPISMGIYAKAKLQDTDKFIVNVGAGVAVEKSLEDTQVLVKKQLEDMRSYREQMLKGMQLLSSRAEEIERKVSEEDV